MWGVVQNVSRPTLSCQEMSHAPPMTLEMTATRHDQMYQGIESVVAKAWTAARACTEDASEIESAMARLSRESAVHYPHYARALRKLLPTHIKFSLNLLF